jgi:hypothetical protein
MRRFSFARESFVPKGALKVLDKQSDAVAYLYERNGRLFGLVFTGKRTKPDSHYRFRSSEERERSIQRAFEARQSHHDRRRQDREARKTASNPFVVGDILSTCWGYDQTNREFFEVTAVRGKSVWLREISQKAVETQSMAGKTVPLPGQYVGEEFRRLAISTSIKIDKVRCASPAAHKVIAGVKVYDPVHWSSYA